jgi:plasmid stabilization system protein ParE
VTLAVRLRAEAEQDLADAATWYETQMPGLGHQFLDEMLATFSSVSDSPLIYPIVHRNTRRALTHRFPFGIYYRIEKTEIVVLAVMHGSRNPHRWKIRA